MKVRSGCAAAIGLSRSSVGPHWVDGTELRRREGERRTARRRRGRRRPRSRRTPRPGSSSVEIATDVAADVGERRRVRRRRLVADADDRRAPGRPGRSAGWSPAPRRRAAVVNSAPHSPAGREGRRRRRRRRRSSSIAQMNVAVGGRDRRRPGPAPRSYRRDADTVRSGAATGTLSASRNENISRLSPQASDPAGSMICGKTVGAWLPAPGRDRRRWSGSGVAAQAPRPPDGTARRDGAGARAGAGAGRRSEPAASGERACAQRRRGGHGRTIAEVGRGPARAALEWRPVDSTRPQETR